MKRMHLGIPTTYFLFISYDQLKLDEQRIFVANIMLVQQDLLLIIIMDMDGRFSRETNHIKNVEGCEGCVEHNLYQTVTFSAASSCLDLRLCYYILCRFIFYIDI